MVFGHNKVTSSYRVVLSLKAQGQCVSRERALLFGEGKNASLCLCLQSSFFVCSGRFLFILLGPVGKGQQYHEIGRSMATIMTDEVHAAAALLILS